jgi:hypothetical protein
MTEIEMTDKMIIGQGGEEVIQEVVNLMTLDPTKRSDQKEAGDQRQNQLLPKEKDLDQDQGQTREIGEGIIAHTLV